MPTKQPSQSEDQDADPTSQEAAHSPEEKPQNGIAGLKHWRYDLLAGLVVSLVSLPLSSGIAIASGAPPIYGIISSVIAGLIYPFVQGSFVTISGPAAGLAPALVAIMISLGGAGDATHVGAGYHMLLVVIFFVGLLQIIIAKLKLARFASIFPASVVEGMLAAIGVLILIKALPLFVGYTGPNHAHGFIEYMGQIPHWLKHGNTTVLEIGIVGLVVMFLVSSKPAQRFSLFRIVPPHIFAVVIGIGLGLAVGLSSHKGAFLIQVPSNPFQGISFPAFGQLFARPDLWKAAVIGVITLVLIDGVESLATAQAIDRIDPFERKSEPNRVLAAMGISNMISSLLGGLTVIPGGVKSKTCIEAGGRTLWANFANALFLMVYLFLAPGLVNLIPKTILGGILIYTGWKMAHPAIARHIAKIGREQFALYLTTIVTTLLTDLLIGVLVGTSLKYLLVVYYARTNGTDDTNERPVYRQLLSSMFKSPVGRTEIKDTTATLYVENPLVCFNSYKLQEEIEQLQENSDVDVVLLHIEPSTRIIDHTSCEAIFKRASSGGSRLRLGFQGLDNMKQLSTHEASIRLHNKTEE